MATEIVLTFEAAVARATFRTADGLNVLSSSVLDRLAAVAEEVRNRPGVRALVLAAEGKVFVAGADIKELSGLDPAGAKALSERGNGAFDALAALPMPTIARLHGAAMGGGLEVALACDFRIADGRVKLGLPEAALGLVPGWSGIRRLAALVGPAAAKRIMFSAAPVTAEDALRLGFVDDVAADVAELDQKIAALIEQVQRGGPQAIARIKRALAGEDEIAMFAECFGTPEANEGLAAFLEKRPAGWMKGL
jgi:enoyl-CoA hydratase